MTILDERLLAIGIPPECEFRRRHPGAQRQDGWSAIDTYSLGVAERARFYDELSAMGFLSHDLSGKVVLDYGCGLAPNALALASRVRLAIGIDASFDHCVSAVESVTHAGMDNVGIFCGSVLASPEYETLPLRAGSFDLLTCFGGLSYKDMLLNIPDWAGLVRSGGSVFLVYPRFWLTDQGLAPDELELRSYLERRTRDWRLVNEESIDCLARVAGLHRLYQGPMKSIPAALSTGVIFVQSGIVADRQGFAELIGDFSRRWRLHYQCVVWKRV